MLRGCITALVAVFAFTAALVFCVAAVSGLVVDLIVHDAPI